MAYTRFSSSTIVAVIRRATKDGRVIRCEQCGFPAKKHQVDHIIPDSLGGLAVLENAQLLCEPCYRVKNPQDTTRAAETKRQTARRIAKPPGAHQLRSKGFQKFTKPERAAVDLPARRPLYEEKT
jgi:5-methylcytosine-specific restriction endonuclease McrA